MIGNVIYSLLAADVRIIDITNNDIFPVVAAQGVAKPYITYQQISRTPTKTKDREDVLETYRIQVDMYADSHIEVESIAEIVKEVLSYQSGTIAEMEVDSIMYEDENPLFEDAPEIYRIQQDYIIRIKL